MSHFAHSFKDRLGCAPFEFQRNARVSKAAQLLANGDLSIDRIAFKVGVDSVASFTRMFRRKTGLTPSEFRRKLLAGNLVNFPIVTQEKQALLRESQG